jgi:hypothetical protein
VAVDRIIPDLPLLVPVVGAHIEASDHDTIMTLIEHMFYWAYCDPPVRPARQLATGLMSQDIGDSSASGHR